MNTNRLYSIHSLFISIFLFFSLLFTPLIAYEVIFEGSCDAEILTLLRSVSHLEKFKETQSGPVSSLLLKKRIEADRHLLVEALHSQGYYDATVNFATKKKSQCIIVTLSLGQAYALAAFEIDYLQHGEHFPSPSITLENLGVQLGAPATPDMILSAEEALLNQLNLEGYALATVQKRQVLAHTERKCITVLLTVDVGSLTYFGPVQMSGLERVDPAFVFKKLRWHANERYDPRKIEQSQEALELSGLFRSVNISQAETLLEGGKLPLSLSFIEAKQRSIGFGLNYTTSLGPGLSGEWEDRNLFGKGQKLSIQTDLWVKLQEARLSYLIPDFGRVDQQLIWRLEFLSERTKAFDEQTGALSVTLERKLRDSMRLSYGLMYKRLYSEDSHPDGLFDLIQAPVEVRWSCTDSLLDPTRGGTLQFKCVPSVQLHGHPFCYVKNTMTCTGYIPLSESKRHIFATKLIVGSIIGAGRKSIPPPERFYAGSSSTLRGYRYLTVSPLDHHDTPLGGRSLWVGSVELRSRFTTDLGTVLFYDVGSVSSKGIPSLHSHIHQSVGLGVRYYTPVGPIRLDVAFPLNKRRIDHVCEAYFSIGQAF